MPSQRLTFSNDQGIHLAAKLDMPVDQQPIAFAVFAHCFTCNKNFKSVRAIIRALNQEGIAVFSFDFTGLGESEGEFADTNFSSNVEDLVDAAAFVADTYEAPQILIGHSLGGAAVLKAAPMISSIRAVATIGAPAEPVHVKHHFEAATPELEKEGVAHVQIAGRPFTIKQQFVEDLEDQSLEDQIADLGKALLILHAPQDLIVGIDNAARIYHAARHPKSFISLDGADHLLSHTQDAEYVGLMIASWAHRYIDLPDIPEEKLVTDKQVVIRTGEKGYTTQILAGRHHLIGDEPQSVGGADLGPTPYQYLLTALGTCTGMTLRMYADRKGWDLKEVTVHLSHLKDHAADSKHSDEPRAKIDVIEKEIELEGTLDEAQRARLLEISERCPVHRTLMGDMEIRSKMR